ncbi:MAG: DUF4159 domain-containing protein [Planctomycetes bacterium]|nr:DUF4159 domain-containing protein [Planctomycetota bacterium]
MAWMTKRNWTGIALLGVLVSCGVCIAQVPRPGEFTDEQVVQAIQKGIDLLWKNQQLDGSWPACKQDSNKDRNYEIGITALAAYALMDAGVSVNDEKMIKALTWLSKQETKATYNLAMRCQAWLLASRQDNTKYSKLLQKDVDALVKGGTGGGYGYFVNEGGGDNSNSQYGVLGVWAGADGNIQIPAAYWAAVQKKWLAGQKSDGSWSYWDVAAKASSPTMAAAGIATLFVCIDNIPTTRFNSCAGQENAPDLKAIKKAMEWFEKNFSYPLEQYAGDPNKRFIEAEEQIPLQFHYHLYGIERIGLASGYKYFGQADWYRRGAAALLKDLNTYGKWYGTYTDDVSTAYAILFLVRGRQPILMNKLEYAGDWDLRPRDLANLVRWYSGVSETVCHWQITNLSRPVEELLDAPILYISGFKGPKFTDEEIGKLRQFVLRGGTIFSVVECNGAAFKQEMARVYAALFPDNPLTPVPQEHPLNTAHFKIQAGRPKLSYIQKGVRILAVHCEEDLAVAWQNRMQAAQKQAFEAAANIASFVTDKATLRSRGIAAWPAEDSSIKPAKTIKLARLKHAGTFDPEPLAYARLAALMLAREKLKVELAEPVAIKDLTVQSGAAAGLTGVEELKLDDDEKDAIKNYVQAGGTLVVDAAGGSQQFAESAEKLLGEIFGGKIETLDAKNELYNLPQYKIDKFAYSRTARIRLGISGPNPKPKLTAISVSGRAGVIFSREDLTEALLGCQPAGCCGYAPETAWQIMRNILIAASDAPKSAAPPQEKKPAPTTVP